MCAIANPGPQAPGGLIGLHPDQHAQLIGAGRAARPDSFQDEDRWRRQGLPRAEFAGLPVVAPIAGLFAACPRRQHLLLEPGPPAEERVPGREIIGVEDRGRRRSLRQRGMQSRSKGALTCGASAVDGDNAHIAASWFAVVDQPGQPREAPLLVRRRHGASLLLLG
ncbi:hypothetical protein MA6G0728R_3295 [Mycobacteroides abscessus 6G-0728-R]|uniref:Uncharacterized protein n=3 Tax=Mycobacteroides abscessus TaxID=36809 RepID=A0A829PXH7_9MYCO|nr:hypothetical protein MA6G0125S_3365 [Mycobacteroides abscessus 6G-0125-S]EIU94488.1 hypothetical protein MA6G0728R_3295 [Mycobacteroides abscessus 6G-0728-R]EIV50907.1 hypothetical protein MA3A0930S_3351 [Mycobacteroides abscessus 3A-0930-S]EUA44877.1 hypothetical protein I543_3427 [Mycobacteroides abscessus 21]